MLHDTTYFHVVDASLVCSQDSSGPRRDLRTPDSNCFVVAAGHQDLHVPDHLVVEAPHAPAKFEHVRVELSRDVPDEYGGRGVAADRDDRLVVGKVLDALNSVPDRKNFIGKISYIFQLSTQHTSF